MQNKILQINSEYNFEKVKNEVVVENQRIAMK